jgi:hypothetical protein
MRLSTNIQPTIEEWRLYRQDVAVATSADDLDTVSGGSDQADELSS